MIYTQICLLMVFLPCPTSLARVFIMVELLVAWPSYGGMAFLWRKPISDGVRIIGSDSDSPVLALTLQFDKVHNIKLFNVHFPCFEPKAEYTNDLCRCLGYIESVFNPGYDLIIAGDMNFVCSDSHIGFSAFRNVFQSYSLSHCDDLCSSVDRATYCNSNLNQSSFIDHFLKLVLYACCSGHFHYWP